MFLRVVVGFHFFSEGTAKLQDKNWTAQYFLSGAKGPAAPLFHRLVDDIKGNERLCVERTETEDGEIKYRTNIELTETAWTEYLDVCAQHYGFNDPDVIEELKQKREKLAESIRIAKENNDKTVDTVELGQKRDRYEATIKAMRQQVQQADELLQAHMLELAAWLDNNQTELIAHYSTENRVSGCLLYTSPSPRDS